MTTANQMQTAPTWHDGAACADHLNDEIWFPHWQAQIPAALRQAQAICNRCPVFEACLLRAVGHPDSNDWERDGLWAGTTPAQRLIMRRKARKAAAA